MKRLIEFWLLLLMVFWGGNAWADKTMTFNADSPTNDCNLTKLSASPGHPGSIAHGGITLTITAASDENASWSTGSDHGQTIALKASANITISSSAEMKITKIVFNFETNNKGYFAESSTTGGTLDPTTATSYVTTQTWSLETGASSVSLTNNSAGKAYITSIDITYKTGGLDNYTVQAYPYTWNFTDDKLWEKSESQFVSEIWTYSTDKGANEWRNTGHEPATVATGYDVDLLRGLRFTGHVCADRKTKCVFLLKNATITIPSLHKGQKVKIFTYTGVGILPTTNLKVFQERKDNIEIYKVTQDGDAILTIDDPSDNDVWGVWISQISVLDALTMTTPYNQDEAPLTTRIILSANTTIKNSVTATLKGESADGSQTHDIGTVTGIANGNKLVFTPKEGQQLRPNYTYTLHLTEKAELQNVEGGKFEDDTFVFTTAEVIGNAPIVESTSPVAESTIKVEDVQPTASKQIEIKFKEDIQLLDGALIFCRPMGGSESYTSIEYYSARSNNYNTIHAKGNRLWFEYSGQHLFYGMRYEVTIPTYAIVGNGGQPMAKNIKFYFETPKSGDASDSRDRKDVYTWDFTNISPTTFAKIKESVDEDKTYWGFDEKNHAYGSSKAPAPNNRPFAQGQEIKAGASNTFILPELKGLLFNLVKYNSNRFQIVCENGSETKGNTYLYLNGGTHYVTIQSVPAKAMVYIEHNGNEMFNLNTLGVKSFKTITNSNNNCVSVYQLGNTAKDLTFCVQNCKLYRIAIVKDNKTIGSATQNYIKYATYSQIYPVDYSLNERLNGTAVTAYSVSTTYQSDATFVNFTELPHNQSARGEGVILKTSGKLGEKHPIFTTDVNTNPGRLTSNALVGTGAEETKFDDAKDDAKKKGCQNYILTTKYFHLGKEDQVIDGNQQCFYKWVKGNVKSNLAYLQLKNPDNTNAKTVIYLDWFGDTTGIHGMTAPSQVTSGKTYYTLDGRKVTSPTQKGIYIINGKKIIIK